MREGWRLGHLCALISLPKHYLLILFPKFSKSNFIVNTQCLRRVPQWCRISFCRSSSLVTHTVIFTASFPFSVAKTALEFTGKYEPIHFWCSDDNIMKNLRIYWTGRNLVQGGDRWKDRRTKKQTLTHLHSKSLKDTKASLLAHFVTNFIMVRLELSVSRHYLI